MEAADRALLAALAAETARVRDGLDEVAGLAGELIRALPADARGSAVSRAQAIDALVQHLDGLSGLLRALSTGETAARAIAALPLADMAARLSGSADARPADAGDLHLFE